MKTREFIKTLETGTPLTLQLEARIGTYEAFGLKALSGGEVLGDEYLSAEIGRAMFLAVGIKLPYVEEEALTGRGDEPETQTEAL